MKMSMQIGKRTKSKQNVKLKTSVCFLCDKPGKIQAFTKNTLIKCRKVMELQTAFKHRKIELPTSFREKGYHVACYKNFIGIKNTEIESSSNSTQNDKQDKTSDNTLSVPIPIEISSFKAELEEDLGICEIGPETQDIKKEFEKVPNMENQFSMFTNYVDPDISKSVILKSILTRKTPVRKDMTQDSLAFTYEFTNQASSNLTIENIQPKIVKTTTFANKRGCIFCSKEVRRMGRKKDSVIESTEIIHEKVLSWAKNLHDYDLIRKLKRPKPFLFHLLCKTEYRYKIDKFTIKNCDDDDLVVFKNIHTEAFESLCAFIDDNIINKHKTYFLSDLHERHKVLLYEIQNSSNPFNFDSYTPNTLQEKIIKTYYGIIEISISKIFKKKVVYKSELKDNFDRAIVEKDDLKYDKLAFELRSAIKSVKRSGENVTHNDIPEKLFNLIGSLTQGPDVRRINSNEDCVKLICKDIVAQIVKED